MSIPHGRLFAKRGYRVIYIDHSMQNEFCEFVGLNAIKKINSVAFDRK